MHFCDFPVMPVIGPSVILPSLIKGMRVKRCVPCTSLPLMHKYPFKQPQMSFLTLASAAARLGEIPIEKRGKNAFPQRER